jgi:hypothetical protein
MKKPFPKIKKKNQGKFTAWAKKNGFKDACSAASAVMKSKNKYSKNVVEMANYANNFGCKMKKPKMSLKKTKNPKFLEHLNPAKVVGDTLNFGRSVAGAQGIKLPI